VRAKPCLFQNRSAFTTLILHLHEQGGGHDERDQAFFFHGDSGRDGREQNGLYHPVATEAIAEPRIPPKSA
jgi:hypothetical protein